MAFNSRELSPWVRKLQAELGRLRFNGNFEPSFEKTVTIPASKGVLIPNPLDKAPARRIIFRSTSALISDGETWNADYVSLINQDSVDAVVTVTFYRD